MRISNLSSGSSRSARQTLLDIRGLDFVTQLVGQRMDPLHQLWKAGFDLGRERGDAFVGSDCHGRVRRQLLAIVLVRSIFFCSWMMP